MSADTGDAPAVPRPVVLVTGLSGAGKASVLRIIEDLGFETVDNPPLDLLEELVGDGDLPLAAGIDTRTRGFAPAQALATLARLRERRDIDVTLVYVTAEDSVLLRRYTETRRRHPLAPGGSLGSRVADGIAREQALLVPLRDAADMVVDTSDLPLPALRQMIERRFQPAGPPGLALHLLSFAFPKGLPREADLVFDVRFLRNPHYVPALKPLTGANPAVAAYVEADPDFAGFWTRLTGFIDPLLPRYVAEGKKYLTVALGCTGGRHRSVLVAERLADHLRSLGWRADVTHRELGLGSSPSGMTPPAEPTAKAAQNASHSFSQEGREALSSTP
ncbi:nucleotide-binding protein [Siccirubricoccus deserti]|uniref:RNase adapter RapZ n=1 Tax=Siccirubricoccus deserti TaxID=2013562 RepID=A0A9X0QWM5_9PROT|nr:RNase adapter RapZ [Siccirubricoccus deserti]MBC4014588.1 RNase adapter RapZ [Siccirubricoccus deserti]GGC31641.1 nucleotide-binding protein [Siccirubricoccus deserti]